MYSGGIFVIDISDFSFFFSFFGKTERGAYQLVVVKAAAEYDSAAQETSEKMAVIFLSASL